MTQPVIGQLEGGGSLCVDVPSLIETRLLVQAMSGGGKSWTLRRLLEQTHGQVQHIVLDPEGEFPSLRERYDYVLIGKGGDKAARVEQAAALARSMLELQANVICDLSELSRPERKAFVRRFVESLVDAPKTLWHPALVVVDEAHSFCPQGSPAESSAAVNELLSKGRKRGFCAVLATQRLAKLDKDAAAECGNVMVGRTVQDVDRARALDVLAVSRESGREISRALMTLAPGAFYSTGVAFRPQSLSFARVGPVETRHPQIGRGQLVAPTPPPSDRVRAVLAKLDHIAAEKEEEAAEVVRLRGEVADLRRHLAARPAEVNTEEADALREDLARARAELSVSAGEAKRWRHISERLEVTLRDLAFNVPLTCEAAREEYLAAEKESAVACTRPTFEEVRGILSKNPEVPLRRPAPVPTNGSYHPRAGARRMLKALARFYPAGMTPGQLRLYAGMKKSGTYDTYIAELKREGVIEIRDGQFFATETGRSLLGAPPPPITPAEVLAHWRSILRGGCVRMLDAIVEASPRGLTGEELRAAIGMAKSGTYDTYVAELKRAQLVEVEGGTFYLAETLREAK